MTQGQIVSVGPMTGSMPTGGRWGWYQDHDGNSFRRVSTLVKYVETDTYNLDKWRLRQVAEGLAIRDDLVFAVKAMGRPPAEGWSREQKKQLNDIAGTAMEIAKTGKGDGAKVGTGVHTLTERLDRGEPLEGVVRGLPAAMAETVRAYEALRRLNGWRTVEVERTVVCDELEVAGTLDRIEAVPGLAALLGPGECQYGHSGNHAGTLAPGDELPVIADVKTEESPWLNGLHIGPQLGIYARAQRMWRPTGGTHAVMGRDGEEVRVPNGEYVPAPCVRQDVGIVVHLRDGKAVPYFINLREGWNAAVAAYEQMNRENRAKRKLGAAGAWFAEVPGIVQPKPAELLVQQAVAADYANPNRPASVAAEAYPVGAVVTVGGIDFTKHSELPAAPAGEVAVRDPETGLVGWQSAPAAETDGQAELRRFLIEAIWRAVTVDGLAILWNMAKDRGVRWSGPVEMAADARRRQIECVQRVMHVPTTIKCACGWMNGQIA